MVELTVLTGRFERAPRRPPVVVLTKLRPPRAVPGLVPRPRLVRLLDEGRGRALTLVVAPLGYGKTTLLAQWTAACARPVAWLSLDERDRDPFRLWAHVGEALASAMPGLRPLAAPGVALDTLIPRLAEEVADGPPAVLVLDDYHRLGRGASEGTLRWFAERTAPTLQVVLAGRVPPPFPLGLLRARGRLLEVGPVDLRLTEVEELALAGPAGADAVPDGMEGWPAGVRLGLERADAAEFLAGQALVHLGDDERRFLLRASILDELTAPLCDEVLGRRDSRAVLRALERETTFLVPLDERRRRYRVHRGLALVLRRELERAEPAAVADLHRRAAAWHRRHGEPRAALEHALAGGASREAALLVRRTWRREVDEGRHAAALARVERLPAGDHGPRLELVRAWLLHLAGRREEGLAALAAAVAAARGRARPLVEREAPLVQAAFCWDGAAAGTGSGPVASWAAGWSLWWRGRPDEAAPRLEAARSGSPLLGCAATAVLSRIAGGRGERDRALALAREARARAGEHGLSLGMVPTALGAALAARGEADAAAPLLEEGLRLRREWGHPLELVDSLLVLAPLAAVVDGRPRAAALLAEAGALVAECGDPGSLGPRLGQARRQALPRPGTVQGPALSRRELAVLRLLATGLTKREVGAELHLSFNTVHSHTKSIYRKLDVSSRAEAIAAAEARSLC
jgi:LuxR family maltose regulon positive regulatory protein